MGEQISKLLGANPNGERRQNIPTAEMLRDELRAKVVVWSDRDLALGVASALERVSME